MVASRTQRRLITLIEIIFVVLCIYIVTKAFGFLFGHESRSVPGRGRYSWNSRTEHYPVDHYTNLPKPTQQSLPRIQYQFSPPQSVRQVKERLQRLHEIQVNIKRAWDAYHKHAFPRDELEAVSGKAKDIYGNWAKTLVESLGTLWISGLKHEFHDAVAHVAKIDFFNYRPDQINLSDVTSHFLAGLLSAYDLSGEKRLLDKATEVATVLYAAFDTPDRMPNVHWDIHDTRNGVRQTVHAQEESIAELGGLALEFTRLAVITGNAKWYDAVARLMKVIADQQMQTEIPGLWPTHCKPKDKDFRTARMLMSMADSGALYETLPKMYALLRGSDMYRSMHSRAMDPITEHVVYRPNVHSSFSYLHNNEALRLAGTISKPQSTIVLEPSGEHAGCFLGGTIAYGGRLFSNDSHVELGRQLINGCLWATDASPNGLMPERFTVIPCTSTKDCDWDQERYETEVRARYRKVHGAEDSTHTSLEMIKRNERIPLGFTSVEKRRYDLSGDLIEGLFNVYRITGDSTLPDKAWQYWTTVQAKTRTTFANAAIEDVTDPTAPKEDIMPSVWLGETLKYFYLMFSSPETISLDEWVFTTRGHPLKLGREDL